MMKHDKNNDKKLKKMKKNSRKIANSRFFDIIFAPLEAKMMKKDFKNMIKK